MTAHSLHKNLRSYLRLTTRVVSKVGDEITVGEKFTIRFTATNSAYGTFGEVFREIVFLNTRIHVEGTEYATPTEGAGWHDLPEQTLSPGESSHVDIEFTADKTWPSFVGATPEHVAKASITADLDQAKFFQLRNQANVFEQIEPT